MNKSDQEKKMMKIGEDEWMHIIKFMNVQTLINSEQLLIRVGCISDSCFRLSTLIPTWSSFDEKRRKLPYYVEEISHDIKGRLGRTLKSSCTTAQELWNVQNEKLGEITWRQQNIYFNPPNLSTLVVESFINDVLVYMTFETFSCFVLNTSPCQTTSTYNKKVMKFMQITQTCCEILQGAI